MLTQFIFALFAAVLAATLCALPVARTWQAVARAMAVNYATSPAPTPISALAWYSKRATRHIKLALRDALEPAKASTAAPRACNSCLNNGSPACSTCNNDLSNYEWHSIAQRALAQTYFSK